MSPPDAQLDNPYLVEQLQFMQEQEETYYQHDNYLPSCAAVTPADRRSMCSWAYDIVDSCSIQREVACIGISYFDRFMCTSSRRANESLVSRSEFQLAFITCLIIALKCRAGMHVDSDFVAESICQNLYSQDEINEMEKDVLSALQWRLNGPSPHEFIAGFVELLPSHYHADSNSDLVSKLTIQSNIQAEEAMLDYSIASQSSSAMIAYAALVISVENIDPDTTVFRPLDQVAWMESIAMVTGMEAKDRNEAYVTRDQLLDVVQQRCDLVSSPVESPKSTVFSSTQEYNKESNSLSMNTYNYCRPVSSTLLSSSSAASSLSMKSHEVGDEMHEYLSIPEIITIDCLLGSQYN